MNLHLHTIGLPELETFLLLVCADVAPVVLEQEPLVPVMVLPTALESGQQ